MKTFISKKKSIILGLLVAFCGSCTDLDEELYGRVTPESFYQTDVEVLSAMAGVYSAMSFAGNGGNGWRVIHLGTDEFLIPSRSDGRWGDGGVWLELANHTWTPQNNRILSAWREVFTVIGRANAVLENLGNTPREGLEDEKAEMRAVRAYAYFYAMDLFGNVPLVTQSRIDPKNLPKTNSRAEVFDFVVSELNAAIPNLPSVGTGNNRNNYYGRITKEAAYSILAITYLNGQVYTGKSSWQESIAASDMVINSGGYSLPLNFLDNFVANNHTSPEFIYAITVDPGRNGGANNFVLRGTHDSHRFKYNLPFTPQNGFTVLEMAYDRYEDQDVRKSLFLLGPQTDANGRPLPRNTGAGQLVLVPHQNITNSAENEGYRLVKWQPDPSWVGQSGNNDVALIRFAEILLTKAEALLRSGGSAAEALRLVNRVRTRSNATPLATVTLTDIYDERARELIWEGSRRRDMIRFGTFLTWDWRFRTTDSPKFRELFPVPIIELNANPNLTQNPGY
ncbi:RagB/SusD family nutrient uptake outer membrane protein [Rufibacter glacialis]|uniref:RagB/SusD family nutrient uptake outer membrane protein n=1 Tax=Rufibacter glacialis TaxID=1259555 RepID=A0A5M8QBA8_9BACT|nr:RagB/SusD family nutrient uptake outer membrane protein [Rufibacter glacialis]KAA6432331.1 RagB/SusD family nutrient uptake outer membrane protein [Rufibacter glacialis]GGK77778.1 hypothetical protein GCM10011405_27000 [Rufibacter glacialis]